MADIMTQEEVDMLLNDLGDVDLGGVDIKKERDEKPLRKCIVLSCNTSNIKEKDVNVLWKQDGVNLYLIVSYLGKHFTKKVPLINRYYYGSYDIIIKKALIIVTFYIDDGYNKMGNILSFKNLTDTKAPANELDDFNTDFIN